MPYSYKPPSRGFSFSGHFTSGVQFLLISNTLLFVIYYFSVLFGYEWVFQPFGLTPANVIGHFAIWQLVTYMFLHDPLGFSHILFNMLTLWMFGRTLEQTWGTRRFLNYYFLCGIGAGVCVVLANLIFGGNMYARTIGASGAIYGLLLAFGLLFPDVEVLFFFLFPVKAKYFVAILGAIAFMSSFAASGSGVSHVAHLGGMIFGYLYLRSARSRAVVGRNVSGSLAEWWREYKLQRARRKFQVYLKKRDGDQDRWVH